MKKFQTLLISLLFIATISGCSTKRQYFEPTTIQNESVAVNRLTSDIDNVSINAAILKNGNAITKNGLLSENIKFPKDTTLLNASSDNLVASSIDGNLTVKNKSGQILFQRSFNEAIVSAAFDDDKLALLSAQNKIYLIDIRTNETLLEFELSDVYAQNARVASPIFMSSIIIFPTLDGKIVIVDKNGNIIRDVVVSSEQFFNNVVFLDVVDNTMLAATAKKIVSISPEKTVYYNGEIKDVVVDKNNVYILEKDGTITLANLQLQKIKSINFKFAIFSASTIYNESLYAIEKTGYLIKTDLSLDNSKVYKLNSSVEDKIFTGINEFYYKDYTIKLK